MKIILTGATGYVGEGVLLELLKMDEVEKAMVTCSRDGYEKTALTPRDITTAAKSKRQS